MRRQPPGRRRQYVGRSAPLSSVSDIGRDPRSARAQARPDSLEQLPDRVGRVAPVPARRPHRREPAPRPPSRSRPARTPGTAPPPRGCAGTGARRRQRDRRAGSTRSAARHTESIVGGSRGHLERFEHHSPWLNGHPPPAKPPRSRWVREWARDDGCPAGRRCWRLPRTIGPRHERGILRTAAVARAPRRRALRRARHRRRHHRRRRRPRRRRPRPAHRPGRARRLRLRHVVEVLEAGARRPALPPAGRRPPRLRGPAPSASGCARTPRTSCKLLPFLHPDVHRARTASIPKGLTRALGTRHVDVRPHRRRPHRQAPRAARRRPRRSRYMPTLPADRLAGGYLYYDAAADDARLTLTIARTAALDHGAVVANGVARHRPAARTTTGSAAGAIGAHRRGRRRSTSAPAPSSTPAACGPTTCAPSTRAPTPTASARPRASTSPCRGTLVRNTIAVVVPVPKDKRSVFVVPWGGAPGEDPRFTYIGTTDTDYDGPLDDPQCTPEDIEYLLRAINFSVADSDDHRGRHPRHLGRAPPAGEVGDVGPHRRPVPRPPGAGLRQRRRHRHRRQAHDLPPHGRRHRRHRRRAARRRRRGPRRPPLPHQEAPPPRRRRLRRPGGVDRRPHRGSLANRYGGEATCCWP